MAQVLTINGNIVLSGGGLVVDERPPLFLHILYLMFRHRLLLSGT